jgi:hypothetical protein
MQAANKLANILTYFFKKKPNKGSTMENCNLGVYPSPNEALEFYFKVIRNGIRYMRRDDEYYDAVKRGEKPEFKPPIDLESLEILTK